jgi:hypothetical protein
MDLGDLFGGDYNPNEEAEEAASLAAQILLRDADERDKRGAQNNPADDEPVVSTTTIAATATVSKPAGKKRKGATTETPAAQRLKFEPGRVIESPCNGAQQIVLPPALKVNMTSAGGYTKGGAVWFRATYPNAEQLGNMLAGLQGVLTDYELEFDHRTGLSIVGMNTVNTIYVDIKVPTQSFVVFNLSEAGMPTTACFSVSSKQFFNLRSVFDADYTLTLGALLGTKVDVNEEVQVQLHPALTTNQKAPDTIYGVPQFDGEHQVVGNVDPAKMYQFRVVMRTTHMRALIERFSRYGDTAFRLSNRGLDVLGFDGDTKSTAVMCVQYTDDTQRDTPLSAYRALYGVEEVSGDNDARWRLNDAERAMLINLGVEAARTHVCHLDRLVKRTARCAHMDCITDGPAAGEAPIDPATNQPVVGRPTCRRDETSTARMSQIDNIRFRTKFLKSALSTITDTDYVELFFGRQAPPDDETFFPLLMRGRVFNTEMTRTMMSRMVYISTLINEK